MFGFHYVERSKYVTAFAGPQVEVTRHLDEVPNGLMADYDDFAVQAAPWGVLPYASAELAEHTADAHDALVHTIQQRGIPIRLDDPQTARRYAHLTRGVQPDDDGRKRLPDSFGVILRNKNQRDGVDYTATAHLLGELTLQPIPGVLDDVQSRVGITLQNTTPQDPRPRTLLDVNYNLYGGGYATMTAEIVYPQGNHPAVDNMWYDLELDQIAPPISMIYPEVCNPAMFTMEATQVGPNQLRALTRYIGELPATAATAVA